MRVKGEKKRNKNQGTNKRTNKYKIGTNQTYIKFYPTKVKPRLNIKLIKKKAIKMKEKIFKYIFLNLS